MIGLKEFLQRTTRSLGQLIKAMLISSGINFIIMLIGFYVLGISFYGLKALLIGILDLLPVVGGGIVLIPWSIISLVSGKTRLALGLIIIYLITFLVKQILEPIIMGKSIGLNPIYTLGITIVAVGVLGPALGTIAGALISVLLSVYLQIQEERKTLNNPVKDRVREGDMDDNFKV